MSCQIPDPYPVYRWPDGWTLVRALGAQVWNRLLDEIEPWGWSWDDTYAWDFTLWLLDPEGHVELVLSGHPAKDRGPRLGAISWRLYVFSPGGDVSFPLPRSGPFHMKEELPSRLAVRHIYDVLLTLIEDGSFAYSSLAVFDFGGKGSDDTSWINTNPLWLPYDVVPRAEDLHHEDAHPRHRHHHFQGHFPVRVPTSTIQESSQGALDHDSGQMRRALWGGRVEPARYLPWYLWARLSETWNPSWPYVANLYEDGRRWQLAPGAFTRVLEEETKLHGPQEKVKLYRAPGALWSGLVGGPGYPVLVNVYLEPPDRVRWEVTDPFAEKLGLLAGAVSPAYSYEGPLDAMRKAQLVISSEERIPWLEQQAIEGEPTFPNMMYEALGVVSPMYWDKAAFLRWVEGMTGCEAIEIREDLRQTYSDESYT